MNTTNDNIDRLVKEAVKIASLEKPDDNFHLLVMNEIESLEKDENKIIINNTPLITVNGWLFIFAGIISIFAILLLSGPSTMNFSFITNYISNIKPIDISFPFTVSKIFLTGLFAFVFFFIIQISIIKKWIEKA